LYRAGIAGYNGWYVRRLSWPARFKADCRKDTRFNRFLANSLKELGYEQLNETYFDTLKFELGTLAGPVKSEALNNEANLNYKGSVATISIDETTSPEDIKT
jgi:hypothetical protein